MAAWRLTDQQSLSCLGARPGCRVHLEIWRQRRRLSSALVSAPAWHLNTRAPYVSTQHEKDSCQTRKSETKFEKVIVCGKITLRAFQCPCGSSGEGASRPEGSLGVSTLCLGRSEGRLPWEHGTGTGPVP